MRTELPVAHPVASGAPFDPSAADVSRSAAVASAGVLHTPRLRIIPATAAHVAADLAGRDALAALLGAAVPASWPPGEYDADAQRLFLDCLEADGTAGVGWYVWYAVRRADAECEDTVVAAGGYAGPPTDADGVELWFAVCPEWRGRGYGRELVVTLAACASRQHGGTAVTAQTMPENVHALRVLTECGFAPEGTDADTGALRFAYRPELLTWASPGDRDANCGCPKSAARRAAMT